MDGLCELLDEVEVAEARPAGLAGKLAALLWSLGEALCRRGRPHAAAQWLHRALPLLAEEGLGAAGWRALMACHSAAGEDDAARRCAETALAHDPSDAHAAAVVLADAAARGERELVEELLARSEASELCLSVEQAGYVAGEAARRSAEPHLRLRLLEMLLRVAAGDPEAAREAGFAPPRILRALLEAAEACGEPARLAEYLGAAAELPVLPEAEARWFLAFAWRGGVALAEAGRWADGGALFGRARRLLERCGSSAAEQAYSAICLASVDKSI